MAEKWAGLAEAIGMEFIDLTPEDPADMDDSYWMDGNSEVSRDYLPAYLMEPAQTARILKARPEWRWQVSGKPGKWVVTLIFDLVSTIGYSCIEADDFGEAVARCAAGLV